MDYLSELNREIEDRICKMEQCPEDMPKRFSRKNYIVLAVVVAACLLAVILGAYL